MKTYCIAFLLLITYINASAQKIKPSAGQKFPDSMVVKVYPSYNKAKCFHKIFFGENYRKEWAVPVKLPVLRLSKINGGLTVVKAGGGTQTKSNQANTAKGLWAKLAGFYDVGRVWVDNDTSNQWHSGTGGGLYFAPASLIVLQVLAGHSTEGWYPYVSLNFRL